MKKIMYKLIALTVIAVLAMSTCVFASDAITIDSVVLSQWTDASGEVVEGLVKATVAFTAVDTADEITILVTSEDISELNEDTASKVVYIDQRVKPASGEYVFPIEAARIAAATGLTDIEGCTLYVKMGGTNVDEMASDTFTYNTPAEDTVTPGDIFEDGRINARDSTMLKRYVAGWDFSTVTGVNLDAMDVNADDRVNGRDSTVLSRYLAGWDVTLQ